MHAADAFLQRANDGPTSQNDINSNNVESNELILFT